MDSPNLCEEIELTFRTDSFRTVKKRLKWTVVSTNMVNVNVIKMPVKNF